MECVAAFISVVELFTNMIITYICVGITGVLLGSTLYYREKWQKCEQTLTEQTQNMLDAQRKIKSLLAERVRYETHCALGRHYMKCSDEVLDGKGFVVVHGGCEPDATHHFVVKAFEYNPNDPEDREFAIREAKELIETIKKF